MLGEFEELCQNNDDLRDKFRNIKSIPRTFHNEFVDDVIIVIDEILDWMDKNTKRKVKSFKIGKSITDGKPLKMFSSDDPSSWSMKTIGWSHLQKDKNFNGLFVLACITDDNIPLDERESMLNVGEQKYAVQFKKSVIDVFMERGDRRCANKGSNRPGKMAKQNITGVLVYLAYELSTDLVNEPELELEQYVYTPTHRNQPRKNVGMNVAHRSEPVQLEDARPNGGIPLQTELNVTTDTDRSNERNSQGVSVGNRSSISVLSLNCCGIKKKLKCPQFQDLIRKHDIACLMESKTGDDDLQTLRGYIFNMKNRRQAKIKSGGIIICYNAEIKDDITIIETKSEFVHWCKIYDIVIGAVYIPPYRTTYWSENAFKEIQKEMNELKKDDACRYVTLMGDFNCRTGEEPDFEKISNESKELCFSLERKSQDKYSFRYGDKLLSLCKQTDMFIVNGRMGSDKGIGKLTCKEASVVDYCVASSNLFPKIINFWVDELCKLFSDSHCGIILNLNTTRGPT